MRAPLGVLGFWVSLCLSLFVKVCVVVISIISSELWLALPVEVVLELA